MRALVQRVSRASVAVDGVIVGEIGDGLLVLICATQGDTDGDASSMAAKIAKLRIFADASGKMNRSLLDTGGAALVISQFTLAADTSRGNRPGFSAAAAPDLGQHLYEVFVQKMAALGISVETGEFGADMTVSLVNDGPVTIWLET